ncbi:MAG TPA: hypothetical protein PKK99_11110, partial [Bacteroidia bacterium]|nr:hypothetical protein [Bacteroidia bacterium]
DYGLMMSGSLEPLSDTSIDIIQRFGRVFQQSYTRYLDVQKAEAQAREAKIEASLERVRSRSTGMQKSDELRDVIQVIYEQLVHLGIDIFGAGFTMDYKEREDWQIWAADIANLSPTLLHIPYFDHPYWNAWNDAKRKGLETLAYTMEFEEKNRFALEFGKYMPDLTPEANELVLSTPGYTVSNVFLQHVTLYIDRFTVEPFSDADNAILMRFGNVFEQTYTRFKDLEKAEAQAREAQIEASLERVRSKTMAMHNSNDVGETVACMFGEFVHLSISTNRCGILIFKNENLAEVWTAKSNGEGRSSLIIGSLDLSRHRLLNSAYEALIAGESQHQYLLKGDDLMKYYQNINDQKSYPVRFDLSSLPEKEYHTDYYFPEGAVFAFTNEPIPAEHSKIFKRFAGVFGQTYRRYLDLMRAEAQAREATIEAALERVRAKAMAMHNSADLTLASGAVFTELRNLGINPVRCGVGVLSKESRRAQLFSSASSETGGSLPLEGWVELSGHPVLNAIYESWLTGEDYFPELQGESMITYYEQLSKGLSVKAPTTDQYQTRYGNFLQISVGCLYAWSAMPFDESQIKILKRFASILDLTFRRYFELQIAEANTKEAIRQASLDRVRA